MSGYCLSRMLSEVRATARYGCGLDLTSIIWWLIAFYGEKAVGKGVILSSAFNRLEGEPEVLPSEWRQPVLDIVYDIVPPVAVIVEAGAYRGEDTRILSKVWPKGHLYAFEPDPNVFGALTAFTRDIANVSRYNVALGNRVGVAAFTPTVGAMGLRSGSGSLLVPVEGFYGKAGHLTKQAQISVQVDTLDAWALRNEVPRIDFMWLDMEGYELEALRCSGTILPTVSAIYSEVTAGKAPRAGQADYWALRNYLRDAGFVEVARDFPIIGNMSHDLGGNSLFIRKGLLEKIKRPICLGGAPDIPVIWVSEKLVADDYPGFGGLPEGKIDMDKAG